MEFKELMLLISLLAIESFIHLQKNNDLPLSMRVVITLFAN